MDAYEFFHEIVAPNCEEALRPPYRLRLAWNAIVSLNTVPEFVALHRLGYRVNVDRDLLTAKARLHGEVDGDAGREQSKALARRPTVGSRYRARTTGFGSESRKNAKCPIRGRRGTSSFRFRCCFLDGEPTGGGRNGNAVISTDRSKRASSCRTRATPPPSSHHAFS